MNSANTSRAAVIDLGSNSTRLVIFEGIARNPVTIFNEKAILKLGKGLTATGRLNETGMEIAIQVMRRFNIIANAMGAYPFEVLATAAVRDATNGKQFVEALQKHLPDVPIRILSGEEEADYSSSGVLCGIPDAEGTVADIGGGSLELITIENRQKSGASTVKLGVIRLADRSNQDKEKARKIVEEDLYTIQWLDKGEGKPLYLVGGAFRALARLYMAHTHYPLNIVHLYTLSVEAVKDMCNWILSASVKEFDVFPGDLLKRIDDMPYAALVLKRLLRQVKPSKVVFSAEGLREGWYMRHVAPALQAQNPKMAVAREMCNRMGRSMSLPEKLIEWSSFLSAYADERLDYLRHLACWFSDVGALEHPEYRAMQSYRRILLLSGVAFDHKDRAFLALAVAVRYGADALREGYIKISKTLLTEREFAFAIALGHTLGLAYTMCGGTPDLLVGTHIHVESKGLILKLMPSRIAVLGDGVTRRLNKLGQILGIKTHIIESEDF